MDFSPNLFEEFPPVSKAEWLAQVEKELKGGSPSDLRWRADGGLRLDPFAHPGDSAEPPAPLPPRSPGWEICEDVLVTGHAADDNSRALEALEGGAQALRFVLGFNISTMMLEELLAGIEPEAVSLHFYLKSMTPNTRGLLSHLREIGERQGLNPAGWRGSLHWKWGMDDEVLRSLLGWRAQFPRFKLVTLAPDSHLRLRAPSALANLLKKGADLLALAPEGSKPAYINHHLQFSVKVGTNYFLEIAKLRALRLLWANVLRAWGVENAEMPPVEVHLLHPGAGSDPNGNMIRAASQAMSAILGGADRLTVLPADAPTGETTAFSRRIARNVQHILQLESHLDRVDDPAAGSWFIENLTEKLAAAAWGEFQKQV